MIFQLAKVQVQGVANYLLDLFCQFDPVVANKNAAYKKSVY